LQKRIDDAELQAFTLEPLAIGARVEGAELFLGGHPVRSIAALEDVGSAADRQAIREYAESVAVEAGQPLGSYEPDETFGIDDDAVDGRSDAVLCGEDGRGEALGSDHSRRNEQHTHPGEQRPFTPTKTHNRCPRAGCHRQKTPVTSIECGGERAVANRVTAHPATG
jgi:hypothetical protein